MKKFLPFFTIFALSQNSIYAANVTQKKDSVLSYEITATKLDGLRNKLSAKTGQSSYSFNQENINNLPQAQTSSLNQVLLRAPGVTQNSFGQIHIRGDHSNVQYRINDVVIPQGISGFGNSFDTHFAESVDLLRGVLPAQYGYKTAGVVDIKTKGGKFTKGSRSEISVGGNETLGLNQQLSGFKDRLNYYLSASYLQNNRGIESTTAARNPLHDETKQDRLFGYFSYLLDAKKRLSLIVANSTNNFQIPNNPGQAPSYEFEGLMALPSANLNQRQKEANRYAILALQGVSDSDVDYQVSLFSRQSKNKFSRDYNGDLLYSGVATDIDRSSLANGIEGNFSKELDEKNILRYGFFASDERVASDKRNAVFNLDADELPAGIRNINDNSRQSTQLYGLYLQDEFRPIKKLTLNLGARLDAMNSYTNESQLSPRFGATYDITSETKVYGGYARYFTPPKSELLANSTIGNFTNTSAAPENFNNGKVRAERSNYFDLGIAHKINKNLTLNLDSYYKESKNLLDEGQFGNALIYAPFNYAKGKVYGVEFGADYKKENFSAFLNLAAQKAKAKNIISSQYLIDAEDLEAASRKYIHLDHDQSYSASAGAAYLFYGTTYGVDAIYGSGLRRDVASSRRMPAYIQTNISASRDFDLPLIKKTNIRAAMLNVFNNAYQLHDGSGVGVQAAQYGPRRTVYLILSKSF